VKHLKQRPYECFPTVLAMLQDKTPEQVIRSILGKQLAKASWASLIANPYSDSFKLLQQHVASYLAKHLPWISEQAFSTEADSQACFTLKTFDSLGIMVTGSHIVAFHKGVIFDSCKAAPIPAQEYLLELRAHNKEVKLILTTNKEVL